MTDIAIRFTTSGQEVVIGALRQVGASAVSFLGDAARAFAELGKESVTVAADYQSTLNNFAAVTGKAMETAGLSTQEFSKLFLDLGAKTQFSAGQAAEAAVELAKGGVAVADIYGGALDAALGLAAAGSLDLANAAEIMAKQLGVWGDTGVTATEITDLLAQAANASTVDVDNLALGLAQVGGAAKIAGVEFPDLVQTMAMLAPGFASASDAGTSLKTFLQRMVPSTKEATKEMIALGLATENGSSKFFDSEGAFIGMGAAAELLKEATKDLSEEQRLAAFSTIFGSDALRAASMIAENGAAGFAEMGNAMTEAGTAAEQAALRNQGFNFAMESLKGSIETVQIVLGSAFLPTLTEVINNGLIPFVNNALAFVQAMLAAPDPIKFLTDAIAKILPPDVLMAVQNLSNLWNNVLLPALVSAWAWIQSNVIPLFQRVWAVMTIEGGTAISTLTTYWTGTLLPAVQGFWAWSQEHIIPHLEALWNWFSANLPGAIQTVSSFFNTVLLPAALAVNEFIVTSVLPTLGSLWTWLETNIPLALQTLSNFWTLTLLPAITTVWQWMDTTLVPFLGGVANVLTAVVELAVKNLAATWKDTLKPALEAVYTFFEDNIKPVLDEVSKKISDDLQPILKGLTDFINLTALLMLANLKTGFDGITDALKTAAEWLGKVADAIRNLPSPPDLWTPGSPTPFELGITGISEAVKQLARTDLPSLNMGVRNMPEPAFAYAGAGGAQFSGPMVINVYSQPGQSETAIAQEVRRQLDEYARRGDTRARL